MKTAYNSLFSLIAVVISIHLNAQIICTDTVPAGATVVSGLTPVSSTASGVTFYICPGSILSINDDGTPPDGYNKIFADSTATLSNNSTESIVYARAYSQIYFTTMSWASNIYIECDSTVDVYLNGIIMPDSTSPCACSPMLKFINKPVCGSSSVDELSRQVFISVYPNPVWNELNVEAENDDVVIQSLVVRNVSGQMLLKSESLFHEKIFQLNTSELLSGIYFLEVNTTKGQKQFRFMKE